MKCLHPIDAKILDEELAKIDHPAIFKVIKEYCQTNDQFTSNDIQDLILNEIFKRKNLSIYTNSRNSEEGMPLTIYKKSISNKMATVISKLCNEGYCQRNTEKGSISRIKETATWITLDFSKKGGTKIPTTQRIENYKKRCNKLSDATPRTKRQKNSFVEENPLIPTNEVEVATMELVQIQQNLTPQNLEQHYKQSVADINATLLQLDEKLSSLKTFTSHLADNIALDFKQKYPIHQLENFELLDDSHKKDQQLASSESNSRQATSPNQIQSRMSIANISFLNSHTMHSTSQTSGGTVNVDPTGRREAAEVSQEKCDSR